MTRIAVIDTGLNLEDPRFKNHLCKTGHKNFVTNETMEDTLQHGTHVAGLIELYAGNSNYCLLIYKYYSYSATGSENLKREVLSFKEAIKNKADIINYSGGGNAFSEEEAKLIAKNPQTTFVVAAGNERQSLDIPGNEFWPASLFYKNMRVVGALDKKGNRLASSNYGKKVQYQEIGEDVFSFLPNGKTGRMSGSSMSTAIISGKLVDRLSKSCENR